MKKYLHLILCFTTLFITNHGILAQWTCGDIVIDSRDSQNYPTVQIGDQCWLAANMNIGEQINSNSAGGLMTNNGIIEKYCWQNNINYCEGTGGMQKYGGFYEWKEAMQFYSGQPSLPVQGVCPENWHVPSKAEFDELITFLGGTSAAGAAVQPGGVSGFDALLTGYRCTMNGGFLNSPTGGTKITYYWTSEQSNASNAYFYEVGPNHGYFSNGVYSPFLKTIGTSIRCIRDEEITGSLEGIENVEPSFTITGVASENKMLHIFYRSGKSKNVILKVYTINGNLIKEVDRKLESGTGNLHIQLHNISTTPLLIYMADGIDYSIFKFLKTTN